MEKVFALYRESISILERAALSREVGRPSNRDRTELHLGEAEHYKGAGLVARGAASAGRIASGVSDGRCAMLLHIDLQPHTSWFQDERWYDLIVILDDATSEIWPRTTGGGGIDGAR